MAAATTYSTGVMNTTPKPNIYVRFEENTPATLTNTGTQTGVTFAGVGNPTYTIGADGRGYSYNGTSDAIRIITTWDFTALKTFTVEGWFKIAQASNLGYNQIIRRDDAANGLNAILVRVRGTDLGSDIGKLEMYFGTGSGSRTLISTNRVDDGNWHHFAMSSTGSNLNMYVDGVNVASGAMPGGGSTGMTNIYIGEDPTGGSYFHGSIDEIAIYDSSVDVSSHYSLTRAPLAPGIVFIAPVATASVAAVSPVLNLGMTRVVTVATASVAAPMPVIEISPTANASATKSVTADTQVLTSTHTGGAVLTYTDRDLLGNGYSAIFKLDTSGFATPGTYINKAVFRFDADYAGIPFTIDSVDVAWTEASTTNVVPGATRVGSGTTVNTANAAGTQEIDITTLMRGWVNGSRVNNGFMLTAVPGNTLSGYIGGLEGTATGMEVPVMAVTYYLPGTDVTPAVAPMTVSISTPAVVTTVVANATVIAGVAGISVDAPAVHVDATGSVSATAPAMDISVDMPTATVPNAVLNLTYIDIFVAASDPVVIAGHDQLVDAGAPATASVDMGQTVSVSVLTGVLITPNAMAISSKWVGIYYKDADRYYKMLSAGLQTAGVHTDTVLEDAWYDFRDNALPGVVGTPVHTEGFGGRGAVAFSGDDTITPYFVGVGAGTGYGIEAGINGFEMTIKTTQQNGIILATRLNEMTLEIQNGTLVVGMWNVGTEQYARLDTKINIADGEWHLLNFAASGVISVDGHQRFTRYNVFTNYWRGVYAIGGLASYEGSVKPATVPVPATTNQFVGEMGDIVLFGSFEPSITWAKDSYYEWSDTTIVNPAPIAGVQVTMGANKGKGNRPRMLVLYGLSSSRDLTGERIGEFLDFNSGFSIPSPLGPNVPGHDMYGSGIIARYTKTWEAYGYQCYPVHILDRQGSADGLVTQLVKGPGEMQDTFLDDATGEGRFLDLLNDLNEPVENFDAITFINWPDEHLNTWYEGTENPGGVFIDNSVTGWTNDSYYVEQLINLKTSIRAAVDMGVGLHIGDARMAIAFGIATGYDQHLTPFDEADGRAQELDDRYTSFAHKYSDQPPYNGFAADGKYLDITSINFRDIVSTATDFSEAPTAYVSETMWFMSYDRLKAYADINAMNVDTLDDGLVVGAQFPLSTYGNYPYSNHMEHGAARGIVSLRPDGLVGQVIAKEQQQFYYGDTLVDNWHKDNVTTVLLEKGTMLNGTPLGGRIFVETMDGSAGYLTPQTVVAEDRGMVQGGFPVAPVGGYKYVMDPRPTPTKPGRGVLKQVPADSVYDYALKKWVSPSATAQGHTDWDWDTRRFKETAAVASAGATASSASKATVSWDAKGITRTYVTATSAGLSENITYIQYDDSSGPRMLTLPLVDMKTRGFNWLSKRPWITDPGRILVAGMNVSVDTPAVITRTIKDTVYGTSPMAVRVEVVKPPSIVEYDVTMTPFPAEVLVTMSNLAKTIKAEAMQISVTVNDTISAVSDEGGFVFYLRDESITLYLGKEN